MIEFHKKWITNSCLIIKENYQKINMLDQEIGDGDHGTTILRGLEEAVSHFRANNEFDNSISFMNEISKLMRVSMGGASGILMTIFFKELDLEVTSLIGGKHKWSFDNNSPITIGVVNSVIKRTNELNKQLADQFKNIETLEIKSINC